MDGCNHGSYMCVGRSIYLSILFVWELTHFYIPILHVQVLYESLSGLSFCSLGFKLNHEAY